MCFFGNEQLQDWVGQKLLFTVSPLGRMPGSRNWVDIEVLFTITHGDNFLLPIPGTLSSAGLKDRKLSRTLLELQHQIGTAEISSLMG